MLQMVPKKPSTAVAARENEITAALRKATPAQIEYEARLVERQGNFWQNLGRELRKADRFPGNLDALASGLAPLRAPGGVKATSVLLVRLFTVTPMPPENGMKIWIEMLSPYPPDVLRRAIDGVIRTHKWSTPPLIAAVVEQADGDELHAARHRLNDKIQKYRGMIASYQRSDAEHERLAENERRMRQRAEAAQQRGEGRYTHQAVIGRLRRLSGQMRTTDDLIDVLLQATEAEEDELFTQETSDERVREIYAACAER